jgi:hypothetical protein
VQTFRKLASDYPGKIDSDPRFRHVANEQRILAPRSRAEQEKLNALLKKLIAGP